MSESSTGLGVASANGANTPPSQVRFSPSEAQDTPTESLDSNDLATSSSSSSHRFARRKGHNRESATAQLLPGSRFGSPSDVPDPTPKLKDVNWKRLAWRYVGAYKPPVLDWVKEYQLKWFLYDILAGISTGVLLIPQGMAYATLAGLPAEYGLYTALTPSIIYIFLGPNPVVVLGPTSVVSLLVGGVVSGTANPILTATTVTLMCGVLLLLLGLFRVGFLATLISQPIVVGFTAAAAFIIASTQLKYVFGLSMASNSTIIEWFELFIPAAKKGPWNGWAALMGITSIVFLVVLRSFKKTKLIPGPVIVVLVCTLVTYGFRLDQKANLKIVGNIPKGLPVPFDPVLGKGPDLSRALSQFIVVAAIALVELISISKTFSVKHGKIMNTDMELVATGAAMIVGSFFRCYPPSGSFTRTVLNDACHAKSQLSNAVASLLLVIVLLVATVLFKYLPYAALGAIVITSVIGLFEVEHAKFIFRTQKRDFFLLCVAFFATLLLGADIGVFVSVAVNIFFLLWDQNGMKTRELGELPKHVPSALFDAVHPDIPEEELGSDPSDALFVLKRDFADTLDHPHLLIVRTTDTITYVNVDHFFMQLINWAKTKLEANYIPSVYSSPDESLGESSTTSGDVSSNTLNGDNSMELEVIKPPRRKKGSRAVSVASIEDDGSMNSQANLVPSGSDSTTSKEDQTPSFAGSDSRVSTDEESLATPAEAARAARDQALLDAAEATKNLIGYVIIDLIHVNFIDSTVVGRLADLHNTLKANRIALALARPRPHVLHYLIRGGVVQLIGQDFVVDSVHSAANRCNAILAAARRLRAQAEREERRRVRRRERRLAASGENPSLPV